MANRVGWTRRQVLRRGGATVGSAGGLGLAGFAGYVLPHSTASAGTQSAPGTRPAGPVSADIDRFVTRGDLLPPVIKVTHHPPGARDGSRPAAGTGNPPYIFLASKGYQGSGPGQPGLLIVDRSGRLVWFQRTPSMTPMNFTTQVYRGRPVLTWWAGRVADPGVGYGQAYIADSSYRVIATVNAGNGLQADLHEFTLTPQGTALLTAYRTASADLSAIGGPAKGTVLASVAQEVEVATGKVLFEWDSLNHVGITETQQKLAGGTAGKPFDYFHINSIAVAPDGDLLISARNTWAVYKVARPSGAIRWRLGGKNSDFQIGPGAGFYWQHHVRPHGPGILSLFDDGSSPPEETQSRAVILDVDTQAMRATLRDAYTHPLGLLADNQGSAQLLPDGRVFTGWGAEPYFSEFDPGGELLLDGQLPVGDQSYRAFTASWSGHPAQRPAVVARVNPARGSAVYVSWNGATDVQQWTVLAGKSPSGLAVAGSQRPAGFETMIAVKSAGPYFAVTAHDADGRLIGQSATVRRETA